MTSNEATIFMGSPYEFNMTFVRGPVRDGLELGSVPMDGLPAAVEELGISFGLEVVVADAQVTRYLTPPDKYVIPVALAERGLYFVEDLLIGLRGAA